MAWTEKTGPHSWRVRYPTYNGRIGSRSGFDTKKAAITYANQIEADQRRGIWLDPKAAKTTVAAWCVLWADALDVEIRRRLHLHRDHPASESAVRRPGES